jgi:hypothetical protein
MRNGPCPQCGSTTGFSLPNGVVPAGRDRMYIHLDGYYVPVDVASYLRTTCGHFDEVELLYYTLDTHNGGRGDDATGNSVWAMTLRRGVGLDYSITAKADGYISTPISYTVHLSGTQAFITDHGIVTSAPADHLDFQFAISK